MKSPNDPVLYLKATELSLRIRILVVESRITDLRMRSDITAEDAEKMLDTWYRLRMGITAEWNAIYKVLEECNIENYVLPTLVQVSIELKDQTLFKGHDDLIDKIYLCAMQESFNELVDFYC